MNRIHKELMKREDAYRALIRRSHTDDEWQEVSHEWRMWWRLNDAIRNPRGQR